MLGGSGWKRRVRTEGKGAGVGGWVGEWEARRDKEG